jgi:hypothetical protein
MNLSVHSKKTIMKLFIKSVFTAILLASASNLLAQPGNSNANNNYIPELVFQNPTLVSGTAGQDGAVYKFSNVASGIDARVKIVGRSSSSVVLTNIDDNNLGWKKAFQPILGIPGVVPANQNWWMEFEMRFYDAGTTNKKKIKGFQVTAIDVDGDGAYIQEFVQMNKVKSATYSPVTYLVESTPMPMLNSLNNESGYNLDGMNKFVQGPIQNFTNIDTAGTGVMSTFTYEDKDVIVFRYGAKSNGAGNSTAGERMNSLWFKAFNLSAPGTLPVTFHSFTASYEKKNVVLKWTADTDDTFSHYTVERSTDGKNFTEIGLVSTTGAMISDYHFTDANITSSTNVVFFRLRYKSSKETTYSAIRVVKLNNKDQHFQIITYPNPVVNELRVTLPNEWQGKKIQLELYSANGTRMHSLQSNSASQTETIKTNSLAKGFYIVKASCNGETLQQRIIKD